jgi:epoxyqueuosine reductase
VSVNTSSSGIADEIVALARSMGFALAGVCEAMPTRHAEEWRAWIAAGKHGTMAYLEKHAELRLDPRSLLPGAKSMLLVADLYAERGVRVTQRPGTGLETHATPAGHGRIAKYAQGRDYHRVMKRRLHELADALRERHQHAEYRAFVDTAPILEREHAARAGLGWIGKHTLLIHPRAGSFLLLGGLLTTLELQPPAGQVAITDHCGTCTRCIEACPTQAITPYSVEASRCIAYLTIERREAIDPPFHEQIGEWLFGCDVCQDVCPHNSLRDWPGLASANPEYSPRFTMLDALAVLEWMPADRERVVGGSAMGRATLAMFKRNALIVLGNALRSEGISGEERARVGERIARTRDDADESPMVRETAAAVLGLTGC